MVLTETGLPTAGKTARYMDRADPSVAELRQKGQVRVHSSRKGILKYVANKLMHRSLRLKYFPFSSFFLIPRFSSPLGCDEGYHNVISCSSEYRQQEAIASAQKYGQMHLLKHFFFPEK